MSLIDHRNVVISITDSHCEQAFISHFDHFDDISFLLGRDSATNDCFARLAYSDEIPAELITGSDSRKCLVLNNENSTLVF